MSEFVPKKKVFPLKFPLAAGKQGVAPSRCVYGFRQECALKSVSGKHYSQESFSPFGRVK